MTQAVAALPQVDPHVAQALRYLFDQGGHLLLVYLTPEWDKKPCWPRWQLPEKRPSFQRIIRHVSEGGLIGLLPYSLGLDVLDVDEAGKDGLSDWMTKYPPLADIPSHKPGRVHLYYQSRGPLHNKNPFHLQQYGLRVEIRSCHGFVVLWDPEAVAELVAERSMASSAGGMTRLPRGVLGAKASRWPWEPTAATQELMPLPRRKSPTRRVVTGTSRTAELETAASWALPDPPDHLLQVRKGERNTAIFDTARCALYRLPHGQGGEGMRVKWHALVLDHVASCNLLLPVPMRDPRVQNSARSITQFTWANPYFGRTEDLGRRAPAVQRERGLASPRHGR